MQAQRQNILALVGIESIEKRKDLTPRRCASSEFDYCSNFCMSMVSTGTKFLKLSNRTECTIGWKYNSHFLLW